jgi:hypothetical protein
MQGETTQMAATDGTSNGREVEHAQRRLEQVLTEKGERDRWHIKTELIPAAAEDSGSEGFQVERKDESSLLVKSVENPGVANGLYYLARCYRTGKALPDVGTAVVSRPRFSRRGMLLGAMPLRLTDLSLDTFTLEQWKEYLDFIRELGCNYIVPLLSELYYPDCLSTLKYKPVSDTCKEALGYARELGITTGIHLVYNQVPAEYYWHHPDRKSRCLGYSGVVSWDKAKDDIRRIHEFFYGYFQVDELMLMAFDGGGSTLDHFMEEPNRVLEEAFHASAHDFRSVVPDGTISFFGFGAAVFQLRAEKAGYDMKLDMGKLMASMPANTRYMDSSANLARRYGLDVPENLNMASQAGLAVDNFFFVMDPEAGMETNCSVLPFPKLAAIRNEMDYTVERLSADGVAGYRMCPPIQVIGDYAFLRWAWDPTLDSSEIVDEVARYMNRGREGAGDTAHAIRLLEEFWASCDLHKLDECYRILEAPGASSTTDLMNLRDGVAVLRIVARAAFETEPNSEGRELMFQQLVDLVQAMPVYKGYTTDEVWIGRISEFLRLKSGWWMKFLRSLKEGNPVFTV